MQLFFPKLEAMRIALALRQARIAAGLSQAELARQMMTSQGLIADLESGRRTFYDRYIDKLPASIREPVAIAVAEEYKAMIAKIYADNGIDT